MGVFLFSAALGHPVGRTPVSVATESYFLYDSKLQCPWTSGAAQKSTSVFVENIAA